MCNTFCRACRQGLDPQGKDQSQVLSLQGQGQDFDLQGQDLAPQGPQGQGQNYSMRSHGQGLGSQGQAKASIAKDNRSLF